MSHIKPNKEHMSSFVTLVVLADTIDPEAKALIKKTRFRKNFRLALHGWMEYRIAAMEIATNSFLAASGDTIWTVMLGRALQNGNCNQQLPFQSGR